MASEIVLPQWGMEMQDGTIVKWLKQEGDTVQEGEPIVEVETAKLTTELESNVTGVLARIVAQEGEIVPIRGVLAVIAAPGEDIGPPANPSAVPVPASQIPSAPTWAREGAPAGSDGGVRVPVVPAARRLAAENNIDLAQVEASGPQGPILIADVEKAIERPASGTAAGGSAGAGVQVVPAARRLAGQKGIDLAQVHGSGPGGRILLADVENAVQSRGPVAAFNMVQIQGIRRTIATRMLQSVQSMAQVTVTTEINVSEAMILRKGLSRNQEGGSLSPLHLLIKATARALKEYPYLNAVQMEDQVQLMDQVNIGVAVALKEGLITPVLREADTKTLAQLAIESRELATKTREGKARPEDVTGGSFTVTNLGGFGIDAFTPIINPPQVGILGVGRVVEKPVIADGQIAKGSMMYLSLTFDHRIVDGAPAAEFLQAVSKYLEDPWWMVQ